MSKLSVVDSKKENGESGKAEGRKERDGQSAVTNPKVVTDAIDNLEELHLKAAAAQTVLNEAIKKVAEKSGYLASAIKKLVNARMKDRFADKKRDAEQQLELFNEVGED